MRVLQHCPLDAAHRNGPTHWFMAIIPRPAAPTSPRPPSTGARPPTTLPVSPAAVRRAKPPDQTLTIIFVKELANSYAKIFLSKLSMVLPEITGKLTAKYRIIFICLYSRVITHPRDSCSYTGRRSCSSGTGHSSCWKGRAPADCWPRPRDCRPGRGPGGSWSDNRR